MFLPGDGLAETTARDTMINPHQTIPSAPQRPSQPEAWDSIADYVAVALAAAALLALTVGGARAQTTEAPVPTIPGLVVSMPPPGPASAPAPVSPPPGLFVTPPSPPPGAAPVAQPKPAPKVAKPPVKPKPKVASTGDAGTPTSGKGSSIVALVNDEPITGFAVEQRARFMALSSNIGDRARANMAAIAKDPRTNERLKAILQETINANQGKTREQVIAAFEERKKAFVMGLQKQAVEGARSGVLPTVRKQALQELIEERLKLQEARKNSITITDSDVDRVFADMSQRNKMTASQFAEHISRQGADASVIKSRVRASLAWREVVRKRYGHQINVSHRDIEQLATQAGGEEAQELKLQRITLDTDGTVDQKAMAARLAEAGTVRQGFKDCKSMAALTKGQANARFEDLGFKKVSAVTEPTRSLLGSAKEGEMLPPNLTAAGVELYAVCGKRSVKVDDDKRQAAESQLQAKEFEKHAQRYMHDLRKDALIEMR